jgi:hypothetical protein
MDKRIDSFFLPRFKTVVVRYFAEVVGKMIQWGFRLGEEGSK